MSTSYDDQIRRMADELDYYRAHANHYRARLGLPPLSAIHEPEGDQ